MRYDEDERPTEQECNKQENETPMIQWMKRNKAERLQTKLDDLTIYSQEINNPNWYNDHGNIYFIVPRMLMRLSFNTKKRFL